MPLFPRNSATVAYRLYLVLQLSPFHLNRRKMQYWIQPKRKSGAGSRIKADALASTMSKLGLNPEHKESCM